MTSTALVYVVDDEEPIRSAFEILLSRRGIAARMFSSAEEFLASYSSDWQGCLFADVRMPDMSGTELHRELRKRNSRLNIILMTGHLPPDTLKELVGSDTILFEKPFSAASLMKVLARCGAVHAPMPDYVGDTRADHNRDSEAESATTASTSPADRRRAAPLKSPS